MRFSEVISGPKPVIACLHLLPLPGAPGYQGSMQQVIDCVLSEVEVFERNGVDGLIVENFRDCPFYPSELPPETTAALSVAAREVVRSSSIPVGINALRNDAAAALSAAVASGAQFIRVNVHMGAATSDQGILQGQSHSTLRLREQLKSDVLILADVGVKHAAPLIDRGLEMDALDLQDRGCADGLIVSGDRTGGAMLAEDARLVRSSVALPVLAGSGTTPETLPKIIDFVDGFIVGSYFKAEGRAELEVEEGRVAELMDVVVQLRS